MSYLSFFPPTSLQISIPLLEHCQTLKVKLPSITKYETEYNPQIKNEFSRRETKWMLPIWRTEKAKTAVSSDTWTWRKKREWHKAEKIRANLLPVLVFRLLWVFWLRWDMRLLTFFPLFFFFYRLQIWDKHSFILVTGTKLNGNKTFILFFFSFIQFPKMTIYETIIFNFLWNWHNCQSWLTYSNFFKTSFL